jgi:hypothetical protein
MDQLLGTTWAGGGAAVMGTAGLALAGTPGLEVGIEMGAG